MTVNNIKIFLRMKNKANTEKYNHFGNKDCLMFLIITLIGLLKTMINFTTMKNSLAIFKAK